MSKDQEMCDPGSAQMSEKALNHGAIPPFWGTGHLIIQSFDRQVTAPVNP